MYLAADHVRAFVGMTVFPPVTVNGVRDRGHRRCGVVVYVKNGANQVVVQEALDIGSVPLSAGAKRWWNQDVPGHPGTAVALGPVVSPGRVVWGAHRAAWINNTITYPGVAAIPVDLLPDVAGLLAVNSDTAAHANDVADLRRYCLRRPVHSPYVTIGAPVPPGPAGQGGGSLLFHRHFDAAGQAIVAPPPGPRVVHGVNVPAFAGVAIDVGSVFKAVAEESL